MLIIGHRGAKGEAPENTLGGFQFALGRGVSHFELDVRLSADGVPVVIHDESVERTTDGLGLVGNCLTPKLSDLDAAVHHDWHRREPVPTLYELLPLLERCDSVQLEIKFAPPERQHQLLSAIGHLMGSVTARRYTITSFDVPTLAMARDLLPQVRRGLVSEDSDVDAIRIARHIGCSLLVLEAECVTDSMLERAWHEGLSVSTYTINEPSAIARLRDRGIDSVITDYPVQHLAMQSGQQARVA